MPISHFSKIYAVEDCKIAKLLTDPSGGSATYGTLIDVPGIKAITISGDVNNVELRGDNSLLDSNSKLQNITVSVEHAKISVDVLEAFLGAAIADTGTTPNQKTTLSLDGDDVMNYFKLEGKTPTGGADTVGGDLHILLPKLILSGLPEIGFAEEDYKTITFEASAVPLLSNKRWLEIVLNETAAAIA